MPKHPGTTDAEKRALDAIGCGESCPAMATRTRDAMLRKGLIQKVGERQLGKDRFGAVTIPVYEMPIPIHIQWCAAMAVETGSNGV